MFLMKPLTLILFLLFFVDLINLAFAFITLSILSPFTEPGQIAFTRILNFPNSTANVLVNPIIAHLLDGMENVEHNQINQQLKIN